MKILAVLAWVLFMMAGFTIFSPILDKNFLLGLTLAFLLFPAFVLGIAWVGIQWIRRAFIQREN